MLAQEVRHSSDFHLIAEIQGRTHYKRTFFVNSEKTLKVKKKKKSIEMFLMIQSGISLRNCNIPPRR